MSDSKVELDDLRQSLAMLAWTTQEKKKLKDRDKELSLLEDEAKEKIKEAMGEKTIGTLGGVPVVKYTNGTKRVLNQSLLKEKFPQIHEICKEDQPNRVFTYVGGDLT